ncbi:MAG: Zn-ribbon domain-containing OB-fold protein [Stellaceae bacterium]
MNGEIARPVMPVANPDTKRFWEGCAEGKLLLQRCAACGRVRHPPSPICPNCLSEAHDWSPASGHGSVYTFVVVHEERRGWEKLVPYVLAVVELDEGVRMVTNLVNVALKDVAIGMPVEVTFAASNDATRLPLFQPATARASQ